MIKKIGKRVFILLVIAVLVIGGLLLVKAKRAKESQTPPPKTYAMVVHTMQTKPQEITLSLPYLAQVENDENVVLSPRVAARVLRVKKSGEKVIKGEIVATLDTADLKASIQSVKVALDYLQKIHKRTLALYRVKGASIEQLQKEKSDIASMKAQLESLKNQMSYAVITAPVSGVVAKLSASEGSVAMPGKPLLSISAKQGFSLLVKLPDGIRPDAVIFENKSYALSDLGSTDQGLHEYKAYIEQSDVSAGETTEVHVVVFKGRATKLPFDAILDRNGKSYVMVMQNDHAVPLQVHIVQKGEEGVVVKEDLSDKKIVVAKPDILLKLVTGIAVKPEE